MIETNLIVKSQSQSAKAVFNESGQNVNLCYQCRKYAIGCPVSCAMDHIPAQLIHGIRLGMDDLVLNSKTLRLCTYCETCTTRCPQDVDVAKVMDAVKITALHQGIKPTVQRSFRLSLK
jgi:heterodisulfide reductase subunit C